jgi:hypothetical protein
MDRGMTLTSEQHAAVQQWAEDGATLNDIQQRLKAEFSVNLTYLDARLLMMDLAVKIKDKVKEVPKPEPVAEPVATEAPAASDGGVTINIDQVTLPGMLVSGKVTFTDGKTAGWYLDQQGRLGMRSPEPGYQPPPADVPVFQEQLDRALVAAGF